MNSLLSLHRIGAVVLSAAAGLSACIVVPVDPRTGQPLGYPPQGDSAARGAALPLPPAPAPLSARLYPLNAQAGRSGALTALVLEQRGGRGTFSVGWETKQASAARPKCFSRATATM